MRAGQHGRPEIAGKFAAARPAHRVGSWLRRCSHFPRGVGQSMSSTPIATSARKIRERLLGALASLQQSNDSSTAAMDIVSGIALANEALSRVEIGGAPVLLHQARAALQGTLHPLQEGALQLHPATSDASALIRESLGMLFEAMREHDLVEPEPAPVSCDLTEPGSTLAPTEEAPMRVVAPPSPADPVTRVKAAQEAFAPMRPSQESIPLTDTSAKEPRQRSKTPTVFPRTAARPHFGLSGLPHIEAELDVHSESNFYTNFHGNIRDRGGIFIATWAAVAVGTSCEVKLQFPGDLNAEVRGVVRWRREGKGDVIDLVPGLGVEITQADDDAWALIQRYLEKRDPIIHDM